MVLFNDLLDDPLTADECASFVGGHYSFARPNLIDPTQAAELVNCDISRTGELKTRRGSIRLGDDTAGAGTYVQGMTYFETPNYNYPVVVNAGKLYLFDGANWTLFANSWSASDISRRVAFAQGVNKLYLTDRSGNLFSWDGATMADLGGALNTSPPASPGAIVWHTSRLCVVGGPSEPDAIYFSQFLDGATYDRANWQIRIGGGEADAITGLWPWSNFNLVVFKRHSIWIANTDPSEPVASFVIKPITRSIGCLAPYTAAQVGSDVLFLATDGVRSVTDVLATETQQTASDPLSLPVQDIIDRINVNAVTTASAIYFDNKYMLALPLDGATSPNYVLVYDALNKSWSGLWTGWFPTAFSVRFVNGTTPRMIFGQSDGTVNEFLSYIQATAESDETFQDNGAEIPVRIVTRAMTCNEPVCTKTGLNAEFEFNKSTARATVQVLLDDAGNQAYEEFPTGNQNPVVLPVTLPFVLATAGIVRSHRDLQRFNPWRELQFVITTTHQKLVLRRIGISAFINTMVLQDEGVLIQPEQSDDTLSIGVGGQTFQV